MSGMERAGDMLERATGANGHDVRRSPIRDVLTEQQEYVARLHQEVERLAEVLEPVLAENVPTETGVKAPDVVHMGTTSDLGMGLASINEQLAALGRTLVRLRNRVEL